MINYYEVVDKFNKIESDVDKWKWIVSNQHMGITVFLDNDDTFATFDEDESLDKHVMNFNWYLGWSDGAFNLLDAIGIKNESV